jgi:tetratricopeptide (TPR) repeat protein
VPHGIEKQVEDLSLFLEHYRDVKLDPILWIGAGASAAAGYPTLAGIEEVLRKRIPDSKESGWGLIREFTDRFSRTDLGVILQKELGEPRPFAPLHEALARLAGAGVCPFLFTTNYDRLIENALTAAEIPFVAQSLEDNFTLQNLRQVQVLKLHGDQGDWTRVVLSAADYKAFDASYPRLKRQLDVNLRTRPILYIGCSMQDPRLLDWLEALSVSERQGLYAGRAILTEKEWLRLPEPKRQLLGQANIKPILVPDHASVTLLLQEIARRMAPLDPGDLTFELQPGEDTWTIVGPTAESAPHTVPNPLADAELVKLLGELRKATGLLIPLSHPVAAATEAALQNLALRIGDRLTEALLSEEARAAVVRRMNQRDRGRALLAIRVKDETPLGDRALALPWELITSQPGRFAVRDGGLDLVREAVADGAPPLPEPTGPLTVAVTIAAPEDQAALDYEKEAFRLQAALASLGQRVAFSDLGGIQDLVEVVEGQRASAVHFSGHGLPGKLVFEDDEGFAKVIPIEELIAKLKQTLSEPESFPRLFFLASCHGATEASAPAWTVPEPGTRQARGELDTVLGRGPSTAAALHRSGFSLVVGYFGPVGDELCTRAEERFYESLAEGDDALQAVTEARATLSEDLEIDGARYRYPLGWAQLAVYLRGADRPLALRGRTDSLGMPSRFQRETVEVSGLPVLRFGFIGRRALQHEVRRRVRQGQRMIVFQGLGGLGKTALASQVVSRVLAPDPKDQLILRCRGLEEGSGDPISVLRAQAEEHGKLLEIQGWDERMKDLREQVPDSAKGFAATIRELRRERPRLVLYADNAESLQEGPKTPEPRAMGTWRSEAASWWEEMKGLAAGGVVLVSTRYTWPDLDEEAWLPVGPMNPADTLRLIDSFKILSKLPRQIRTRLAEKADGHPRTVEFLETLVSEQRRSLGLGTDITDPWKQLIEPVLGTHAEKINSDLLLEALWERLSPAAREHAGRLSVLRAAAPRLVVDRLGGATEELIRSGVLTLYRERTVRDGEPVWIDRWGLHSLMREFVDGRINEDAKRDAHLTAGGAYEELVKGPGARWSDQVEGIHHLHTISEGNRAWPMVQEYVLWLRQQARYQEALTLLERCETAGTRGDRLAKALVLLVQMRSRLGERSSDLVKILERSLDLVDGDETRCIVLHELGSLLSEQGKYGEAEVLLRESLSIDEKVLGTGHPEYGASLHALAGVLSRQGKYGEAEVLLRESLSLKEKVLGTGHPSYGASLHALAGVLESQGKYGEAEVLLRESLSLKEKVLGTGHPSLCPTLTNLAGVLAQQGKAEEGEPLMLRSLEIALEVFGPANPSTAQILNMLAQLQAVLGRPEAASTAKMALQALEASLGADHPITQSVAPILQGIAGGTPSIVPDQIQTLANQARDAAIAAFEGKIDRGELSASMDGVAKQAAEDEESGSRWDQLASYLRAVVALLLGQEGPEVPGEFAEHFAAVERAARGEGDLTVEEGE